MDHPARMHCAVSLCRPAADHHWRAGSPEEHAGVSAVPEDQLAAAGRRSFRRAQRHLERRQRKPGVRADRQAVSIRRRYENIDGNRSGDRSAGRPWGPRRPGRQRDRARTAGAVRRLAGRHPQGGLREAQSDDDRRRRRQSCRHDRRQRERPHQVPVPRAGCTARSSRRPPPCGGRPTAGSWRTTASTRRTSSTTTCSSTRRRFKAKTTSKHIQKRAPRIRSSTCSCTTSPPGRTRRSTCATGSRSKTVWSVITSIAFHGQPTAGS